MPDARTEVATRLPEQDAQLARSALAVLDANWLGHATKPSPRLYPHQWSWDSACIAMGYARWNQDRAETELRSLFAGQWRNGLLPHIVFAKGDGRYFPGPDFWQTERGRRTLRRGSRRPASSSRRFTPLRHGASTGGRETVRGRGRSSKSSRRSSPRGTRTSTASGRAASDGLVEIWHPVGVRAWTTRRSGTRRSRGSRPSPDEIPEYRRVDAQLADPAERPTDDEYDRYAYLVGLFRDLDYLPDRDPGGDAVRAPARALQLAPRPVESRPGRDRARSLGADPEPFESWAAQTARASTRSCGTRSAAVYVDFDVRRSDRVRRADSRRPARRSTPGSRPTSGRARMIAVLAGSRVEVDDARGWAVTSLAPDDPGFMPTRYWRGPIWPILNWVLQRGLDRYGYGDLAAQVQARVARSRRAAAASGSTTAR